MKTPETFDVRMIEQGDNYIDLFNRLNALDQGQFLLISHDESLRPLYFRLLAESVQSFSWETLENGPEVWRVKITIQNAGKNNETIGDIVSKDYRNAAVFKTLGIDFSCNGKRTLEQVCTSTGLNIDDLRRQLAMCLTQPIVQTNNLLSWAPAFVCRYLVNLNHQYIKLNTPFISELAKKVAAGYRNSHPDIDRVSTIFFNAGQVLMTNILSEESSLFPDIVKLSEYDIKGIIPAGNLSANVLSVFYRMMATHEQIVADFGLIRQLTNNYQAPRYVSSSYNILYKLLQDYEDDLLLNFHLENNVLFPKILAIRNKMRAMQNR